MLRIILESRTSKQNEEVEGQRFILGFDLLFKSSSQHGLLHENRLDVRIKRYKVVENLWYLSLGSLVHVLVFEFLLFVLFDEILDFFDG